MEKKTEQETRNRHGVALTTQNGFPPLSYKVFFVIFVTYLDVKTYWVFRCWVRDFNLLYNPSSHNNLGS